jgi:signal peptidase I
LKTDQPQEPADKPKEKGGAAGNGDDREGDAAAGEANGGAGEGRADADAAEAKGEAAEAKEHAPYRAGHAVQPPVQRRSRVLRLVYWFVWFGLVPVVGSCFLVWALSPPSGAEPSGGFGFVQSLVRAQPVPVMIVLFTVFEIALWAARLQLPLSRHAHPPLRADVPPHLRATFERARALLDEAEMVSARHHKEIVRDMTAKERDRLRGELQALREAMDRTPFDEDAFLDALGRAEGQVDANLGKWRKSEVREYVEAILMAVAVAFALRAFVVEAFKIPSGSMIPTLMVGDHIFVNTFSYGPAIPYTHSRLWTNMPPHRGDVMVFAFPEKPDQDFIKRVIAVEGDKLEAKGGHPIINGWPVPSCLVGEWSYNDYESPITRHDGDLYVEYLGDESYLTFYDRSSGTFPEFQGPYFAKKGEVWVMGDNRNNSHDSRMWFGGQGGGVPFENIRGRALFVWLSVSDNGIDWSREGAPVMGRPRLPPAAKALEPKLEECLKNRPSVTTPPAPASR